MALCLACESHEQTHGQYCNRCNLVGSLNAGTCPNTDCTRDLVTIAIDDTMVEIECASGQYVRTVPRQVWDERIAPYVDIAEYVDDGTAQRVGGTA